MPRLKYLRYHVYDGVTLSYLGIGLDRPLTEEEKAAIPSATREETHAREHEYEIETWIDGPLAGQEGIVYRVGQNWIPAHWPRR